MAKITINGQEIEVENGINVIEAAKKAGIDIPHYCYHPGLRIDGNCRMCLVDIKGPRGFMPTIACNTKVAENMEIVTNSENVVNMRKGVMEFLLVNHPIDCPICDQAGECGLQDFYMKYGKYDNRSIVNKVHKNKVVDVGPLVVLDQERCILCSRCVRFCEDVSKTNELVITNRGVHSKLEFFPGKKLDNKYSGNVVDICPVGALTSKDFRFKMRVWFLQSAKSVCHGCSRGCSIELDYNKETTYRFRPRHNPEVNQFWMCDEGRLSYKAINDNRLIDPVYKGETIDFDDAMHQLKALINETKAKYGGPKAIAAVGSPHSSVEDNWMLKVFMKDVVGSDKVFGVDFKPEGYQDDFLIRADKTANRKGLEYLEINSDKQAFADEIASGNIKLLIVMNNDLAGEGSEEIQKLLGSVESLVVLTPHHNKTSEMAKLAIPTSLYAEKQGSLVNFEGQLQKFEKAYDSFEREGSSAYPEWEIFAGLIKSKYPNREYEDIQSVWKELAESFEIFSQVSYDELGEFGINLPKNLERIQEEKKKAELEAQIEQAAQQEEPAST